MKRTPQAKLEAIAFEQHTTEKVLMLSPPHSSPVHQVEIHDVPKVEPQNPNPLTTEDIKEIMDQVVGQATLLDNVVLVSTKELEKATSKGLDKPLKPINVQVDIVNKYGHIDQNKGDTTNTPQE